MFIGDGSCDTENNNGLCGYDGGDCCLCSCTGVACSYNAFDDCLDPTAGDEFYECAAKPPAALPCPAEISQAWTVENSDQARALAAAVNCSGGSFEVEWRGRVVVDVTIYVVDGTVLRVTGADTGAVIDGNSSTRLFAVVDAALHLSDVNITSGASVTGGAVAAAGSVVTFNRTHFVDNTAFGNGGAVFVSHSSKVSCVGGGTFADNRAYLSGGGMHLTSGSTVSCGGSWINNTAGFRGGALSLEHGASMSWREDVLFSFNTANYGGALAVMDGSSVSWSGATTFVSNSAYFGAGAGLAQNSSSISWSGATTFFNCTTLGFGGALVALIESRISWNGSTEFVANTALTGGAFLEYYGSSVSWAGATEFRLNEAADDGGAVASLALDSDNPRESVLGVNGPTTFSNNSCGANGGALALLGGLSMAIGVADVSFINNTAEVAGGAVFVSGTGIGPVFPGVSFVSNSAQVGGAVSTVGSGFSHGNGIVYPTVFEECHFIDNRATATGGAVESAAGQDTFVSCVFEGNKAGTGGALRLAGTAYMKNCSFVENI